MANRKSATADRVDSRNGSAGRAPVRSGGAAATRARVKKLAARHPNWTVGRIAEKLGVTRQRVHQIAVEEGLTFAQQPRVHRARDGADANGTGPRVLTPDEIKEWRLERNITQAEFADMLGVVKDTVARWEAGRQPAPAMLTVAMQALNRMA